MTQSLSIAFIGGGNMAAALISGLAGKFCPMGNIHVVDPHESARQVWAARGATVAAAPDEALSDTDTRPTMSWSGWLRCKGKVADIG